MVDERNQAPNAAQVDAERRRQQQQVANPQQRDERRDQINEAEERRRKRQEEANKQAAEVMEKSTPFPTQEQADQAKLGTLKPDDLQAPDQPEMPPLHEQHQRQREDEDKRRK